MKIGLEVHVQLLTKTKLFCRCPNGMAKEPNTNVCEYCLGFPGSKPRLNAHAIEHALKIGLALNCAFPAETFFSRKAYFYPDMAKNFQITQYEIPVAANGFVDVGAKRIAITRINLEEDPARIVHVGTITKADYVLVDYNRSGVPLCEVVTAPDFSSAKEARLFLNELSSMLEYAGVYDPDSEGSIRVDANISVAETRVEVKNISGFREVEKALVYENVRQESLIARGQPVVRETRAWDAVAGVTRSLRLKEEEAEYGYIFEPDLPKLTIRNLDALKKTLPEFAHEKVARYRQMGIAEELAVAITSEPSLAQAFEAVVASVDPALAARWFAGPILKTLNFSNLRFRETGMQAGHIATLLVMVRDKAVTERTAEQLLREMVRNPQDPGALTRGQGRIFDEAQLKPVVQQVLAENASAIVDYKSGKKETLNFLVGAAMRKTQGRGDSATIRKLLEQMI